MKLKRIYQALVALAAVALLYSAFSASGGHSAFAQSGGLRRESGFVFTRGCFVELTAGGTVSAGDALYLDSTGKVQRLDSTNDSKVIGVADNAGVSSDTIRVQFCGKAEVTADAAVSIGDKVGGTSLSTAGRVRTLANTLAIASGGTTVTSTAANGAIVTGDPVASRVLGRALEAAAAAGDKIDVLILLQ